MTEQNVLQGSILFATILGGIWLYHGWQYFRKLRPEGERLRRLEERGVLKNYTVDIDPKHFGYLLQAIVRIRPLPGKLQEVERQIQAIPEFTECDKVTGDDCFIARLHVRTMDQLDTLLDKLNAYAETNTAIVKKTPVKRRLPPLSDS